MKILISQVFLDGKSCDILIEDNRISRIDSLITAEADKVINGTGLAVLPALYNMHTHTAMTLFRGYADDMALMNWLQQKIWPQEAKLTPQDIYEGTRFGILEMIKGGTVLANDMYWQWQSEAQAAAEMGIRLLNAPTVLDSQDETHLTAIQKEIEAIFSERANYGELVEFCLAPHAVYTVSEKTLRWCADFARDKGIRLHIHISETEHEVLNCKAQTGFTPLQYLQKIGFLGSNVIAAHMIWLDERDFEIVQEQGITVVHCPVSNLKLSSGIFPYQKYRMREIPVCVATDGASSNNNLDLFEEMKFAALLPKITNRNPELATAEEIFRSVTLNPAKALGLPAGEIKEGNLADLILVDLQNVNLIPNYNLISNLVYSAHADCVHTTICNGKILMENRIVEKEEEIKEAFLKTVLKFK